MILCRGRFNFLYRKNEVPEMGVGNQKNNIVSQLIEIKGKVSLPFVSQDNARGNVPVGTYCAI